MSLQLPQLQPCGERGWASVPARGAGCRWLRGWPGSGSAERQRPLPCVWHICSWAGRRPRPLPVPPMSPVPDTREGRSDGQRSHRCPPGQCRCGSRAPKYGPRDVNRCQSRTGRRDAPKGCRSPSTRPGCSGEGGLSPSLPTYGSLTQDRREMQISVNSLPCVIEEEKGREEPTE